MFKWWRRFKYRTDVLVQVQAMALMIGPEAKGLKHHPMYITGARIGFDNGESVEVAATRICGALIEHAIEQHDDIVHLQIVEQLLTEWSVLDPIEQRGIKRQMREGTLNQDMLLTRLQWLLMMAQDHLVEKKIDIEDFKMLRDNIWGPLKREPSGSRAQARLDGALDRAFGPRES